MLTHLSVLVLGVALIAAGGLLGPLGQPQGAASPGASSAAALTLTAASVAPPGSARRDVTLLSYNIENGAEHGRYLRAVAREIRSAHADIVVLNEIDARRRETPQPAWLARRLGMNSVFIPNHSFGGVRLRGNAILSQYPIVKYRNTPLPWRRRTERRGLIRAKIHLGHGLTVRVAGTHLQPGDNLKLVQARQVAELLGDPTCATFLLGDMNAWPRSRELRALTRHFRDPVLTGRFGEGLTKPSRRPRGRIDYTLVAGARATASRTMPRWSSDHRAVRTVFRVRRGATCG